MKDDYGITEEEKIQVVLLMELLGPTLKKPSLKNDGTYRYQLSTGDKTELGLLRTIRGIINNTEAYQGK